MVAREASLKDIIESEPHLLEIPFFQRRYVWKKENWEELLHTLEHFREEKAFWGSVIIKLAPERDPVHQYAKGYVIDGQQRLTTIAILTKAIYDTVDQPARESWCGNIVMHDLFFPPYTSAPKEEYQMIIRHSRVDHEEFEYIVKTGIFDDLEIELARDQNGEIDDERVSGGQMMRCYAYFRKMLEAKKKEEVARLADNLYCGGKVFVLITLDEKDVNEQAIFDSINRAGQKLFTSDIIKNNLFKRLIYVTNDSAKVCNLCDKYWDSIFWTDSFWDEKRQFGNIGKSHLDFLLYSIACIKWTDEPLQNINDGLENVFERRTSQYNAQQMTELITDIAKYALIYKQYIYEFGENLEDAVFSRDDHVNRLLLLMDKFKIQMFYPYVLKRLHENIEKFDVDKKEIVCDVRDEKLNREAKLLEAYIVRRRICSASTSAYSKKCMEILRNGIGQLYSDYKLDTGSEVLEAENREIGEALKEIKQQEVAKVVLFCLELARWDEKDDMGKLPFNYQIEHIMPKKWEEYWKRSPAHSDDVRNQKIKEIGNMILLSQKLNVHLQNREYSVKMEGVHEGKKQKDGYKDKTQLKMTKELVDSYVKGDRAWDEDHITRRTENIYREVMEHWNIAELLREVTL